MDEPHTTASERAATALRAPRRVVVGVAGSIAAYKVPFVIRLLRQAGHEVKVAGHRVGAAFHRGAGTGSDQRADRVHRCLR